MKKMMVMIIGLSMVGLVGCGNIEKTMQDSAEKFVAYQAFGTTNQNEFIEDELLAEGVEGCSVTDRNDGRKDIYVYMEDGTSIHMIADENGEIISVEY